MSKTTSKTTDTNTASLYKDVYARVTDRIVAELEQGVRPWLKPWSASNTDGRILRPLRHNGTPYKGINVLLLWGEAIEKGYGASTWMTYKQAETLLLKFSCRSVCVYC